MARDHAKSRVYKDSTAQQLRSFWQTARLGSLSAAAESLGLSITTVCQQVHDLERVFGEPLLSSHTRGCDLTDAGRLLADLAGPLVENLASLTRRFMEGRSRTRVRLVVATTPRIICEEMPRCVAEFLGRYPDVDLTLKELWHEQVNAVVEQGGADIGLMTSHNRNLMTPWLPSPWLEFKALYELDIILVTPRDHPLARRKRIRLKDLAPFSLVNAPNAYADLNTMAILDREGLLHKGHSLVEALFNNTICRYVSLGYGIGLITGSPARQPDPALHERVVTPFFGRPRVYRLKRKGVPLSRQALAFEKLVVEQLGKRSAVGGAAGSAN